MKNSKMIYMIAGALMLFSCQANDPATIVTPVTTTTGTGTGGTGTGTGTGGTGTGTGTGGTGTGTGTGGTGTGGTGVVTNPTYTANIAPIMLASCTSCHSTGGTSPNLTTYAKVKTETNTGKLLCRMDTQSCGAVMPPAGRMAQATIDMIKLWKTQGFVN